MDFCQIVTSETDTTQALIAGVRNELVAIPLPSILTIESVAKSDISLVDQEDVIYLRGRVIPLIYLDKLFELEPFAEEEDSITVVVCIHNDSCVGLVVDTLMGQKDIETKSLGILEDNQFFSGASILEDNDVAMIINVQSFIA
ncbi:chemotaxis protein CheW [Pseudobutyrivibrio sp.]|uniref:chemotaxis protein CheW n=1 Tax=Pseudobutyrivibrio sp. TaxID=2014367 RepID=UPI001D5EE5EE|nr:chemotaxis protein CheW [Pseudobutyrivibrio sp.]MBE5910244.1 hypothetical protein [Pseudobutyrivibrio sp.]